MKIAFGYKMGSGKDTAVEYCVKKYTGIHISFAKPIYDILHYAQEICGFEQKKDRQFLQYIGTEWARKKDNNVWVNLAINKTKNKSGNFYISDLRFMNEFEALKKENWVLVKLVREINKEKKEERKGTGSVSHSSETSLDSVPNENWDYIINNNSNCLEDFYLELDNLVKKINGETLQSNE